MLNHKVLLKSIPNIITCGNLFFGCMAVNAAFHGYFHQSFYLVLTAAVFDFFDGFAARLLGAYSEFGKILDSLADMVSFGVAPAAILYNLYVKISITSYSFLGIPVTGTFQTVVFSSSFFIAVFSALRLAKFHLDTRQAYSFIGLPTPANSLFIASFASLLCRIGNPMIFKWFLNYNFLVPLSVVLCYLLVSEIPMFSLKFKNYSFADNRLRYVFLFFSLILLILFKLHAFPLIIFLYVFLSIIFSRKK